MEEQNLLIEKILRLAEGQRRKSKVYLILMLATFGCVVFLFFQLKKTNAALEVAKTEATDSKVNFEKYAKVKEDEIKALSVLLEACSNKIGAKDTLSKSIDLAITPSKYSNDLVYIQIRSNKESALAKTLLKDLKEKGFTAPGIDHIDRRFKNRVIYFNDQDRSAAEDVVQFLKDALLKNGLSVPPDLTIIKPGIEAPNGQIEVWINLTD